MDYQLVISIAVYMIGMLYIGYFAYKRTSSLSDYVLGGRTLGPAVTALSAGASDMEKNDEMGSVSWDGSGGCYCYSVDTIPRA